MGIKVSADDLADVQSWAFQHERVNPGDVGAKTLRVVLELLHQRDRTSDLEADMRSIIACHKEKGSHSRRRREAMNIARRALGITVDE
jgi:hypothetical protein